MNTATAGVLCARVRVEEKLLLASLAEAGLTAMPLLPAGQPLPPCPFPPIPPDPALTGDLARDLLIDRCQDRVIAQPVLTLWRARGATILDAGVAATGDRVAVAAALAAAGVPRPISYLAISAEAAEAALAEIGYPATFLPLPIGSAPTALLDVDVAEAVIEHRMVLASGAESLGLVQQGANTASVQILVIDGEAIATNGQRDLATPAAIRIAEHAARALKASIVGVEIVVQANQPVVWDIHPAPDFRAAEPLGEASVAEAVSNLAASRLTSASIGRVTVAVHTATAVSAGRQREEARHAVVLTA